MNLNDSIIFYIYIQSKNGTQFVRLLIKEERLDRFEIFFYQGQGSCETKIKKFQMESRKLLKNVFSDECKFQFYLHI